MFSRDVEQEKYFFIQTRTMNTVRGFLLGKEKKGLTALIVQVIFFVLNTFAKLITYCYYVLYTEALKIRKVDTDKNVETMVRLI